ncbi:MAG: BamA/TamA family outer membrane protein [Prevotella sp.]|nr:BamA/TamA family outer membrane protein [Prevotella sp.]
MKHLSPLILLLLLTACSTTNHIPDDDQLFTGLTKIAYTDADKSDHTIQTQEEVEAALATAPNGALFGSSYYRSPLPIGLWIWNATQDSVGRFGQWIGRTFGKAPVLMSQVNPALHAQVARQVLRSNGYMHGDVTYAEVVKRNPKKAKVAYTVTMDSLFLVDTISYTGFTPAMQQLIDSTRSEARIKSGSPFSVNLLDAERSRVSQLLRNNGYYYYQAGYASYLADTFALQNRVQLRLQLADSLPKEALHPWYIGKVSMVMRRSMMERPDSTLDRRFLSISFNGKHAPIRPRVILSNMKLRPRQLFSYANYQESMQKINATGVFSSADLQFTPHGGDTLDLTLNCIFDKPYDFYIETNFTNRTIGRMGPEVRVGLVRRNAFRGGEKLDINLHGSYEWQTGGNMSTYQYGADVSVEFPRTLIPRFSSQETRMRRMRERMQRGRRPRTFFTPPTTVLKVSSDVVRRPDYYKMHIVSGELTYRWATSAQSRHELSPLTVKYQFMNSHTERFDSLMLINPYLQTTMDNYFIPKMRYTYSYTSPSGKRHPLRCELTVQQSGNLTALYDVLIQGNKWNQKDKTLFKNPYSQFVKVEADITKTWTLSPATQLVGHVSMGLLWSYGNSSSAPFSELFYAGGANSIRAFAVRSIGPGAFPGLGGNNQFSYIMQNGDTKLVANLELRHRLFGSLYGALFLDAGNVWNSEDWTLSTDDFEGIDDDELTNAFISNWNSLFGNNRFRMKNFLRQVATGTGIGLRYDLDFLVLRLDWGFGLHLPYDTGHSGYFNIGRFSDMHTLHFAIGYPF